ncbi:polyprenyl synthetase family protein [Dysgonomonas sp. 520]|uniref:polyprenyl synthetase family protein n=1 Tax=Dysgonomonas sp. 520 TaxID=2302931 RepID=UPI0013D7DEB8|nr:polyprenyl synthetase family protein [Dysgonomonas sp. 520]NDW10831.1 polyprenyl synthetase family protein [Dysgonomonas sp. 520]
MNKRLLITKPIAQELEKFDTLYRSSISSQNPRIQEIIEYSFKSDGKKIRPTLLLLAAKACGEINDTTYSAAITLELLHTASLIHDDVVDESMLRRGRPSMNAIYDNKVAVLAGDYFLSAALIKSVMTQNFEIISEVSKLGRNLAEGELNQLSLAKEIIIDEDQYFEVIRKKTASLLSICMKVGVLSTGGSQSDINLFERIGEYFGICFQLRDDIFDYFSNDVGKPTGNDIKEGKVTLPLLYALKNVPAENSAQMFDIIYKSDFSDENVEQLIQFARSNGGVEYTYSKIDSYKTRAIELIEEVSNNSIRETLIDVLDFIIDRKF